MSELAQRRGDGTRIDGPRRKKSGEISLGAAGVILVGLRLLQLAWFAAKNVGDVYWFLSSLGILASHVGLVVSIVAVVKGSGRWAGVAGVVLWVAFTAAFYVLTKK